MNEPDVMPGRLYSPSRFALRTVVAFAVLPPAAGLLMFFLCLAMLRADLWMFEGTGSLAAARGLGLGVAVLAVPVTVLGAVPAIAWLITRDRLSLRRLVRWGCLIGNAPYAIIVVSVFAVQLTRGTRFSEVVQWFGWFGTIRAIVLGVVFGTAMATLWWVIAVPRDSRSTDGCRRPARRSTSSVNNQSA
jgi:hypothetical protein